MAQVEDIIVHMVAVVGADGDHSGSELMLCCSGKKKEKKIKISLYSAAAVSIALVTLLLNYC